MIFQESETVELKEIVVDDIKKEIIAFANGEGGRLYIGVRDDGTVTGLESVDNVSLQISNMVRDAIKPDLTMFLHYKTIEIEEKQSGLIILQRKGYVRRVFMFDRDILLFQQMIQQLGV